MPFYTITVDTEEEWDWSSGYRTDSNAVTNIAALPQFQQACDRHGASVTYFVNHSVLESPPAAEVINRLAQQPRVEIGLHIHSWNTPPLAPTTEVLVRDSFLANLPRDVALAKLDTVLDSFANCGLKPTSFRGGRYSTCDWIQQHLARRGVIADASILPFTSWPDDGAPDYRDRDLTPVRRDYGDHWIWEIPLTLAFTRRPWRRWSQLYQLGERPMWRQLRLVGIAERLLVQRIWLNLEHPLGDQAERLLPVLQAAGVPCINLTMHSSSLRPGLNSYTRTEADLQRLYDRLDRVLQRIHDTTDYQPATVSEVARHLESQYHACTRH